MSGSLPFSDAIRQARSHAERTAHAFDLRGRLQNAAALIGVLTESPDLLTEHELPGEDLLREAEMLLETTGLSEHAGTDLMEHFLHRAQRLHQVATLLDPLAEEAHQAAVDLHALQHEQHDALADPRYADAVTELVAIDRRRSAAATVFNEASSQYLRHAQLLVTLDHTLPDHATAHAHATASRDPDGQLAFDMADALHGDFVELVLQLQETELLEEVPFEPMVPDAPHPRHRDRLLEECAAVLAWMHRLEASLKTTTTRLDDLKHRAQIAMDDAEIALKERMG